MWAMVVLVGIAAISGSLLALFVAAAGGLADAARTASGELGPGASPPITRADDKLVVEVSDLRPLMSPPPRAIAGLTLARQWFNNPLSEVVDTQYPLYDESVERLRATRAARLRRLGVRRAVRTDFEPRRGRYFVILEALLLPDASKARRALAILRDVHAESWDAESPLRPRKLGSSAWGYLSRTERDEAAAFGFQIGNLALKAQISSVGGDFRSVTHTIALELVERARATA